MLHSKVPFLPARTADIEDLRRAAMLSFAQNSLDYAGKPSWVEDHTYHRKKVTLDHYYKICDGITIVGAILVKNQI